LLVSRTENTPFCRRPKRVRVPDLVSPDIVSDTRHAVSKRLFAPRLARLLNVSFDAPARDICFHDTMAGV
jgi:hypothetical protein